MTRQTEKQKLAVAVLNAVQSYEKDRGLFEKERDKRIHREQCARLRSHVSQLLADE